MRKNPVFSENWVFFAYLYRTNSCRPLHSPFRASSLKKCTKGATAYMAGFMPNACQYGAKLNEVISLMSEKKGGIISFNMRFI